MKKRIAELEARVTKLEVGLPVLCKKCGAMIVSASWYSNEPFVNYQTCMRGHTRKINVLEEPIILEKG